LEAYLLETLTETLNHIDIFRTLNSATLGQTLWNSGSLNSVSYEIKYLSYYCILTFRVIEAIQE
jgi:hypothetical protein